MNILIADDYELVRHGFRGILLDEFPSAVIEEASNGKEAERIGRQSKLSLIMLKKSEKRSPRRSEKLKKLARH